MPQMAPIWWTTLFILFNMSFLTMMIMMYFQINMQPTMKSSITSQIKQYNWKW
uniref:ATP synthase F0 subunit 8 n=1 Tax=Epidaus famulus TaxID=1524511 RepID=UPI002E77D325|nr:ATP synthase F0 subunit 8 [Epidaus famulus]WQT73257.1 ATP synthase F0 subunit 8 [Epidaus famulus]